MKWSEKITIAVAAVFSVTLVIMLIACSGCSSDKIRNMLNDSGYGTNGEKVIEQGGRSAIEMKESPEPFSDFDTAIYCSMTNGYGPIPGSNHFQDSTGKPIFIFSNTPAAMISAVVWEFGQIQIKAAGGYDSSIPADVLGIYVPPKVH